MEQSHTPIDYSAMARENWGLPADATDADVDAARTAHYSEQRHIGGTALQ